MGVPERKSAKFQEADHAGIGFFIARVELRIGKAAAEGNGVPAVTPNSVAEGIQRF